MPVEKTNNPAKEKRDISEEGQVASEKLTSLDVIKAANSEMLKDNSKGAKSKYGLAELKDLLNANKERPNEDPTQGKPSCGDQDTLVDTCGCSRRQGF
jgi:hypothetical protein